MADVHIEVAIDAPPSHVWRALCDPADVVIWEGNVEEALDAPPDYPQPGQHVRWRCRSGLFRILHDRPQEVVPEEKLRSFLSQGLVRYDETYTLSPQGAGALLSADVDVHIVAPFGLLVSRLQAVASARLAFERSLQSLKRHCEAQHREQT